MSRTGRRYRPEPFEPGATLEDRLVDAFDLLRPAPEEQREEIDACEAKLIDFVRAAWHVVEPENPFTDGWHLGCICEHLQALTDLQIRNLIVNFPPRHGKSLLISVFWFCWVWARHPESRWLFSSYADSLATRDGRKCLDIIESPWYQTRWGHIFQLRQGEKGSGKFTNTRKGHRVATSVLGRGLGEGGDYICLPGDQRVLTDAGWQEIGSIVDNQVDCLVASFNHQTGQVEWRPIVRRYRHDAGDKGDTLLDDGKNLYRIAIDTGQKVFLTGNHPVWTEGRGYVAASAVQPDDVVKTSLAGATGCTAVLSVERIGQAGVVYNLEVEGNNNYFAEGVLLHNCTDDPHKAEETYSDTLREKVIRWWSETMSTRGNDPRTVRKVVVMQRLHESDLSGHLIASELDYDALVLPAEYEPRRYFDSGAAARPDGKTRVRDAIVPTRLQLRRPELRDPRRYEGQLLWPERFGPAEIRDLKAQLRSYGTAGQLQQRPAPEEGDIFKKANYRYFTQEMRLFGEEQISCFVLHRPGLEPVVIPVQDCSWYQTIDTALVERATASWTVCTTAISAPVMLDGYARIRYLLIYSVDREHLPVPEQFNWITNLRHRYPDILFQAIEPKASGIGLIQEGMASSKPFKVLVCSGNKIIRAGTVSTMYENGLVYHRQGMPGLTDLEDELSSFPSGANDDQCLAAGSLVLTDQGEQPIEAVVAGNKVWTRSGWKSVTWSGMTSARSQVFEVVVSDGRILRGTASHPVWIQGRGFTRIDMIGYGDTIPAWQTNDPGMSSKLSSTESSTTDSPIRRAVICASTSGHTDQKSNMVCRPCTVRSGKRSTGRFLQDVKSITRTKIHSTTVSTILNALQERIIAACTLLRPATDSSYISPRFAARQQNGIVRQKVGNGIRKTQSSEQQSEPPGHAFASSATRNLRRWRCVLRSTVQTGVQPKRGASQDLITQRGSVLSARPTLPLISSAKPGSAPFVVAVLPIADHVPVYNLSIKDRPEFLANGILVHNCDTIGYAGILHTQERILTAACGGELLDASTPERRDEVYNVNGVEVVFPEEPQWYER